MTGHKMLIVMQCLPSNSYDKIISRLLSRIIFEYSSVFSLQLSKISPEIVKLQIIFTPLFLHFLHHFGSQLFFSLQFLPFLHQMFSFFTPKTLFFYIKFWNLERFFLKRNGVKRQKIGVKKHKFGVKKHKIGVKKQKIGVKKHKIGGKKAKNWCKKGITPN